MVTFSFVSLCASTDGWQGMGLSSLLVLALKSRGIQLRLLFNLAPISPRNLDMGSGILGVRGFGNILFSTISKVGRLCIGLFFGSLCTALSAGFLCTRLSVGCLFTGLSGQAGRGISGSQSLFSISSEKKYYSKCMAKD